MKVLVVGGMHGNEPLGPDIVRLFNKSPVNNVDVVLANPPALRQNCRFIDQDLNRSFPGDQTAQSYELRRAAELVKMTRPYDLVLDFHNTHCPNNDCGFVGQTASPTIYDICEYLGLKKIIVADYDCINKYAPNCLSVEISLASNLNTAAIWYERIKVLSKLPRVPTYRKLLKYSFVYRMTQADRENYGLDNARLKAFEPIGVELCQKLNLKSPAYPIFINDAYTPYNYGGLLNRLD